MAEEVIQFYRVLRQVIELSVFLHIENKFPVTAAYRAHRSALRPAVQLVKPDCRMKPIRIRVIVIVRRVMHSTEAVLRIRTVELLVGILLPRQQGP